MTKAADDNEGACGACKRVGELICCEGCPAAFHCRCAGYDSDEVPAGDWYCWFCAKERNLPYQHPKTVFKPPRASNCAIMLASSDAAEVFYRCRPKDVSEGYIELQYLDILHEDEIVHRSSPRLWHGTTDKNAWSVVAPGAFRPNCRLFQVDKAAMAAAAATAAAAAARGASQQQRQQLDDLTRQPSFRGAPSAAAAAAAAGVQRIPVGEIGAGLPVVVGGASEADFEAALHGLWRSLLGPGYPERMPACQLMAGQQVEPWQLWREVWAWGGPDAVSKNKLWATVGYAFNVSVACTSVSSRIKKSYDVLVEPLDQAIDEGAVSLQRPSCSRKPSDRALQYRNCPGSRSGGAAAGTPTRPSHQQRSRSTERPHGSGKRSRASGRSGSGSGKRRRGAWSSEDDDGPAPDVGSDFDSDGGASADEDADALSEDDVSGDERSEDSGSGKDSQGGSASRQQARTVASMLAARAAAAAAAQPAAAVPEGRETPTLKMAVGKPVMTRAAQQFRVGQLVDFRQWQQGLGYASGWRAGTVLAVEPGSVWEGGSRLLLQPQRSHPNSSNSQQGHNSSSRDLHPPGSSAAAALALAAAAAAAAGNEAGGADAAKLLISSAHQRPGSPALSGMVAPQTAPGSTSGAAAPTAQQQQQGSAAAPTVGSPQAAAAAAAAAAGHAAACDAVYVQPEQDEGSRPASVPLLYRGTAREPLQQPLVMVRQHYKPSAPAAAAATATAAAGTPEPAPGLQKTASGAASPFLLQQQAQQMPAQHVHSFKPSPGMLVEVLRQGSWWPAKVLAVKQPSNQQQQQQQQAAAPVGVKSGGSSSSSCVVLQVLEPPDADGLVWKCGLGQAMRPAHPQQSAGMGVLAAAQGDVLALSQLRKQIAPYTYAGGVTAFACLSHMLDSRRA